jgi:cell division protein FtsI (penicillin-binding protein 3)
VVQKSSNVGTVRLAQRLDNREMGEMYAALGFGVKPQIGFPGAATGKLRPWKTWKPVEKATMSYGYGLSASLLQIARAYTALARDGELAPLTLIKGEEALPSVRVFEPETARTMRRLMRGTVSKEGTAPLAQPIGYSAGGKTGTAEKQEGRGYNSDKHRAWFTGIAPIDQPRVVVAVMVDEPSGVYFGGLVAAPVFKVVVEQALRTLGVPPDLEMPASPLTAQSTAAQPENPKSPAVVRVARTGGDTPAH